MDGTIFYKLRFADNWMLLPQRRDSLITAKDVEELRNLHPGRCKITARKYQDLQDLKINIPVDYHDFYNNIPH